MSTDWRELGDVAFDDWVAELERVDSPLLTERRETYDAAQPHSRLCLGMLWVEQKHATWAESPIPRDFRNPLSLKAPAGPAGERPWTQFATWAEGIRAWRERITDPDYAEGIYARTTDLRSLIAVYAPSVENDVEHYVAGVDGVMARYAQVVAAPRKDRTVSTLDMTPGLVSLPPHAERFITNKPAGFGWDDLGPRTVRGVTLHRMQGTLWGTDGFFRDPTVGALTDFGIDNQTGEILQWVDPRGHISGWASGPLSDPYGDGKAFVDKYGIDAINRDRVSMEIGGFFAETLGDASKDSPLSETAKQRLAQWIAHYAHDAGVPWDAFPIVPADGFSFVTWHHEFTRGTGKVCPGQLVMDATNDLIARAAAILQAAQTGGSPVRVMSRSRGIAYPDGLDKEIATRLFGRVVKDEIPYAFDEGGPVSRLWLDLGAQSGAYPELVDVQTFGTRSYFVFGNGLVIWRPNKREAVRLLTEQRPAA